MLKIKVDGESLLFFFGVFSAPKLLAWLKMGSEWRVHRDRPSHRLEPQAGRLPLVRHDLIPAFRCVHPLVGVSALCCTRHWGDKLVEYHQTLASHESRRNVRLSCYYWITFLRFWQSGPSLLVGDGLGPAIREKHPQSHSLSASETSESSESSTFSSTSSSSPHYHHRNLKSDN